MNTMTRVAAILLLPWVVSVSCVAGELTPSKVSFWNDVRPIFQVHCHGCHQPAKKGGGYVMTSFSAMMTSGESEEKPIVPGDIENSYLVQQVRSSNGVAEMPKGKPAIDAAKVALIEKWILDGAVDDSPRSNNVARIRSPNFYTNVPPITAMDVSADGNLLAISGYHEVIVHDLVGLRDSSNETESIAARLSGLSERIESIAFSPNGNRVAVAGGSPGRVGEVQIWELGSNELLVSLSSWHDCCFGVSWSPNGRFVAVGCPDNSVQIIEASTGEIAFANRSHSDWVLGTAFSSVASQFVSVSRDRTMKLFDLSSKRFVTNIARFEANQSKIGIQSVSQCPNRDQFLIAGPDRVARIYQTESQKVKDIKDNANLVAQFAAVPGRIFDGRFSTDGQRIIVAGDRKGSGFAYTFAVDQPKVGMPMQNIKGGIFAALFLDDNASIAAAGFDSVVYLNDASTGQPIQTLDPFPRKR